MKYIEFLFYTIAWVSVFFDTPANVMLGFISIGLMWKCVGEMK